MSIRPMPRKCPYCGYKYSFNPDVGKFFLVCPKCGKKQSINFPTILKFK